MFLLHIIFFTHKKVQKNSYKAQFILTAFLPQRQNAAIFPLAMISDLTHSLARNAGESSVLPPAGQRHGFSGCACDFCLDPIRGPDFAHVSTVQGRFSGNIPKSEIGKIHERLAGFYHYHH